MPLPNDLLGKLIPYTIFPGLTTVPTAAPGLMGGHRPRATPVLTDQTSPANLAIYEEQAAPALRMATHRSLDHVFHKTPRRWSFTFLKYVAGGVTIAPLAGTVLTGPMSGCFLCTFMEGGVRKLAHVGTYLSPDDEKSIAAKTAWKAFVAGPTISDVKGNSPADFFSLSELQRVTGGVPTTPQICGYFNAAGTAYAMAMIPVKALGFDMLKIVLIKPMPLMHWSAIQGLRTFR